MLKTNEKNNNNSSKLIRGEGKKKGWAEKQNVEKD